MSTKRIIIDPQKLDKLFKQGLSDQQIAKEFKCGPRTLMKYRLLLGFRRRPLRSDLIGHELKTKNCSVCGKPIGRNSRTNLCRSHYNAQKYTREYLKKYRTEMKKWAKTWRNKVRAIWGNGYGRRNLTESAVAEKVGYDILKNEGFTNIAHVSTVNRYFPFDFIVDKDDKTYLIDVTTAVHRDEPSKSFIAERLKLKLLRLFINPSLTKYIITEKAHLSLSLLQTVKELKTTPQRRGRNGIDKCS